MPADVPVLIGLTATLCLLAPLVATAELRRVSQLDHHTLRVWRRHMARLRAPLEVPPARWQDYLVGPSVDLRPLEPASTGRHAAPDTGQLPAVSGETTDRIRPYVLATEADR